MTVAEQQELFRRLAASLKTTREFQEQMLAIQRAVRRASEGETERFMAALGATTGRPISGVTES